MLLRVEFPCFLNKETSWLARAQPTQPRSPSHSSFSLNVRWFRFNARCELSRCFYSFPKFRFDFIYIHHVIDPWCAYLTKFDFTFLYFFFSKLSSIFAWILQTRYSCTSAVTVLQFDFFGSLQQSISFFSIIRILICFCKSIFIF